MGQDLSGRDRWLDYGKRGLRAGWSTMGDFQKFLLRGNVVDLAVGVVIGAAFNGVVQSIVKDFITPLIGLLVGSTNFSTGHKLIGKQDFLYGDFINTLISFILVAAVVYFFVVKPITIMQDRFNHLTHKDLQTPTTRECPYCLSTVPLQASRCAYCTSQLPPANDPSIAVSPHR